MTVGFYYVGPADTEHVRLARLLITSARRTMGDTRIVQFTTADSAQVPGVDHAAIDPPAPLALGRLRAYAACYGDWLFVDTDVLIQRDVRDVFRDPFDVAVANRAGTLLEKEVGTKFMTRMPHNAGAVFSRRPAFWHAAATALAAASEKRQAWMGDQQAMCDVIASGAFAVKILPSEYNYPPKHRREDVSDKAVLHFKGARKAWMLECAA